MSTWNGLCFFSRRRIAFLGQAGNTTDQQIHGIKICLALERDFELIIEGHNEGAYHSAVIINAGVKHTFKCDGSKVFLIYLLPEIQSAQQIRWEFLNNDKDNCNAGVYDIPKEFIKESLPFLPQVLREYSKWGGKCKKVFQECDNVLHGLGKIRRRQISTSTALAEKINGSVKKTINYIYNEIENQIKSSEFDLSRFGTSVICGEIGLPPNKVKWLEKVFKTETGITIGNYFRDIQMLASLNLYAVIEGLREDKEKELLEALKNPMLTEEERNKLGELLEEISRGTFVTPIADSVGFGDLSNFDARIRSRLGISHADLRGESKFYTCHE